MLNAYVELVPLTACHVRSRHGCNKTHQRLELHAMLEVQLQPACMAQEMRTAQVMLPASHRASKGPTRPAGCTCRDGSSPAWAALRSPVFRRVFAERMRILACNLYAPLLYIYGQLQALLKKKKPVPSVTMKEFVQPLIQLLSNSRHG
jgi:hypothetical protein